MQRVLGGHKRVPRVRSLWLTIACAALGGCALASSPSERGTARIAGTYELWICHTACEDETDALVRGHLVLEDSAYAFSDLPERARSYLEAKVPVLVEVDAENRPNACFVLQRAAGLSGRPYAGLDPVGVTRWLQSDADSGISFALWHSWDAGYGATLSVLDRGLTGEGRSWDATLPQLRNTVDIIVARRIGPPDRALCIRAAEQLAASSN